MAETLPEDSARAREDLVGFLRDLRDLLDGLLYERPELFGYGHASFLQVWKDEAKGLIESVIAELERKTPQPDRPLPVEVDERLRSHGLTGRQLEAKLAPFRPALVALLDEINSVDEAERWWHTWLSRLRGSGAARFVRARLQRLRASGRRAIRSRLGRVLRIANHILDSLGDAMMFIPGAGAAVTATREFKESLEVAAEEPDEVAKRAPQAVQSRLAGLRQRVTSR